MKSIPLANELQNDLQRTSLGILHETIYSKNYVANPQEGLAKAFTTPDIPVGSNVVQSI